MAFIRPLPHSSPPSHADLQDAFDADWQAGRLNSVGYLNGTEDGILAYKLLIQTGSEKDPFNYSLVCFLRFKE